MTTQPDFRALCSELYSLALDLLDIEPRSNETIIRHQGIFDRARAALNTPPLASIPVSEDTRYEFSVFDREDEEQAGGSAQTLEEVCREGKRYLSMYSQGQEFGPYRLELRQVQIIPLPENQP
jgi:hypothetical protein